LEEKRKKEVNQVQVKFSRRRKREDIEKIVRHPMQSAGKEISSAGRGRREGGARKEPYADACTFLERWEGRGNSLCKGSTQLNKKHC